MDSVARAGKQYVLYGRDRHRVARYGYGDPFLMSSPGQYAWIDRQSGQRRPATIQDALDFQVYVEVPLVQQVEGTQLGVDWQADFTFGHRF